MTSAAHAHVGGGQYLFGEFGFGVVFECEGVLVGWGVAFLLARFLCLVLVWHALVVSINRRSCLLEYIGSVSNNV